MAATPTPLEVHQIQEKTANKAILETLSTLKVDNYRLTESLENIQLMLDERGFQPLFDYRANGMSLHQVELASRQLRELVVGNPIMKRGSELRNDIIWGKGVDIDLGSALSNVAKKRIRALISAPSNQMCLFSDDARTELERAAYTDGNTFILGNDKTKKLQRIPLTRISGAYSDPDNHDNVWAIRRTWTRNIDGTDEKLMNVWYYLDTYDGPRSNTITSKEGMQETVDTEQTMFWTGYNRHIGWVWGIPDALPAIAWSKLWKDFLIQGTVMSKALAHIAYKVTAKTADGMNKMTAAIQTDDGSGKTFGMMDTMDLTPLSTAGRGYDFESGEPLANMVAAGLGLTAEELLAKPNTDKADGVPASTKRSMRSRQRTQGALIKRVLVWMGASFDDLEIDFPEIDDQDTYRRFEQLGAAWGTGLFAPGEIREEMAEVGEIELTGTMPADVLTPNTKGALEAGAVIANKLADANLSTTEKPVGSTVKADGSNDQKNGQGADNTGVGKRSKGDNGLRDGTMK